MNRIIFLGLLLTVCFFCEVKAQSLSTKIIRIEVDGKEVSKNYRVSFLSNGNWVRAERTATGFIDPNELKTEKYLTVLIAFGKYRLKFSEVHISNFTEDWIVGVGKKPFSDEFVKAEDAKTTKRAYYIQLEGGEPSRQLVITEKKIK